jgi:hypothetical protein
MVAKVVQRLHHRQPGVGPLAEVEELLEVGDHAARVAEMQRAADGPLHDVGEKERGKDVEQQAEVVRALA